MEILILNHLLDPVLAYMISYVRNSHIGIDQVMQIVHLGILGSRGNLPDLSPCSNTAYSSSSAKRRLEKLLKESGNGVCADCGTPDPKWVLSVKLDEWTDEQVDVLVNLGGNNVANNKYEALIPENLKKLTPDSSNEERADFIRRKYEMLQFFDGNKHDPHSHQWTSSSSSQGSLSNLFGQDKRQYEKQPTRHRIGQKFRNSWGRRDSDHHKSVRKSNSLAGMVEFIGMIKVNVVKGTNLAVRDMVTSDPYVMLTLGQQSVKTRVIKNNLNPVWNESLMLSIPDSIPPLKVIVYDKDTFSHDDFMGEAEIDIQPLVAAAKAHERSEIQESMQLGKWVASKDNTLEKDGIITVTDGKVKQDISLRLQKVERGVLEIELECVPLTQ
ncbi:putative ADP-ribosylation factor GTPase-activating protein AGD11 [Gossypium australe]|uniref:Putative ADP-ribosylation factor GTPase-activating protein AGD11 n=1 Tax=Gossypium australe TaxID=47621 RepID=A0A5B6WJ26_9ROSI|nr:putative ADP-ribosylation factor GTPase-activating protein AGD11 [Gossypium australe]